MTVDDLFEMSEERAAAFMRLVTDDTVFKRDITFRRITVVKRAPERKRPRRIAKKIAARYGAKGHSDYRLAQELKLMGAYPSHLRRL